MISNIDNLSDAALIEIRTYADILSAGGIVAFPTETVYGLGADAWNPSAISKIFEIKGRPTDNPLIVHISNYGMLLSFAAEIPVESRLLMQKFWPGPLTLVFEKKNKVLDLISAGLPSVAVRMPDHDYALKLIDSSGPLVAPSANKSGRPSPTKPEHVHHDFGNALPILKGGDCSIGIESTVLDVRTKPFRILRPGRISAMMILERTGIEVENYDPGNDHNPLQPVSPGVKYSHYAPETPLRWMTANDINNPDPDSRTLYLTQNEYLQLITPNNFVVNFNGNLDKMARELYDWFRKSDIEKYDSVVIEPLEAFSNDGFYAALGNRIAKAISKK